MRLDGWSTPEDLSFLIKNWGNKVAFCLTNHEAKNEQTQTRTNHKQAKGERNNGDYDDQSLICYAHSFPRNRQSAE